MLRSPEDFRKALAGHQPRSVTERIQAAYIEYLERRVTELEWLNESRGSDRIPFLSQEPPVLDGPFVPSPTLRLPLMASVQLKPDKDQPGFHVMMRGQTSDGPAVSLSYYLSEEIVFGAHDAVNILTFMHERVMRDFAVALAERQKAET